MMGHTTGMATKYISIVKNLNVMVVIVCARMRDLKVIFIISIIGPLMQAAQVAYLIKKVL